MAPQRQYQGARAPFVLGILSVALLLTGPSWSSEVGVVTESPYIDMTIGYQMHVSGVCSGSGADYEIGMGHRWKRMAIGASLFWVENMDCEAITYSDPGGSYPTFDARSDIMGILATGRFYISSDEFWSQPYLALDMGASTGGGSPALVLRGGIGAEVRLFSGLSIDIRASYYFSVFEALVSTEPVRINHDFLAVGCVRYYF